MPRGTTTGASGSWSNVTLDQGKIGGDPLLDRLVRLGVSVPAGAAYTVRHYRIDAGHSNIVPAWEQMSGAASWPDADQWAVLGELNTLDELGPPVRVTGSTGSTGSGGSSAPGDGRLEFAFELPMPAVSYLELAP